MKRSKIDAIDRKILYNLQYDGRMTNVEISQRVNISAPPCLRRIRALEKNGFIKGYYADLDGTLLGFGVTVFAHVRLTSHTEADLASFEAAVSAWSEIRECYMLAGDDDFMLKVVARDWENYQDFLTHRLVAAPFVAQVRSSLSIRRAKFAPGIPFNDLEEKQQSTQEKTTQKPLKVSNAGS
ncbi:MAG: Lrp/AsnC family transcriptional regulator [Alphaproteobacteria bacterium]